MRQRLSATPLAAKICDLAFALSRPHERACRTEALTGS